MSSSSLWQRFQQYFLYYRDLGFSLDISRMKFPNDFFKKMRPKIDNAFAAMRALEAGAIANPTEKRMVGHYWLRNPALAPTPEIRTEIEETVERIKTFAADIRGGKITAENGKPFKHVLLIGIGGSALGPQFVSDALGSRHDPIDILFFDNTDPDGFDRIFEKLSDELAQTLVVVVSKSGGTKETRNGMLEAELKFKEKGLQFNKHAVAVTGVGSDLDKYAEKNGWLARFPMHDWIGGITMSIPEANAFNIGALIALYERAVGFYGSLVNINAYDQPGVEAGKMAAIRLLELQKQVRAKLTDGSGKTGSCAFH
jgi:glucose-6-phosphate isomerase